MSIAGGSDFLREIGLLPDNTHNTGLHVWFKGQDGSWFMGNELSQQAIDWLVDNELGFTERMDAVLLAESDCQHRNQPEAPKKYIPKPGSVYVIRINKTNKYKIGYTAGNVRNRVANHQVSCPDELFLIHTCNVPDCLIAEAQIHQTLKKYRKQGEWFEIPTPKILANALKPHKGNTGSDFSLS